jgi:hypothetical protein
MFLALALLLAIESPDTGVAGPAGYQWPHPFARSLTTAEREQYGATLANLLRAADSRCQSVFRTSRSTIR